MKKSLFAAAVLALAAAMPAEAVTVTFQDEFSGGVNCSNLVTGCSVLTATTIAGGVHFTFTGTMGPGEFITSLYGNFDGGVPPTLANLTGDLETLNGTFTFGNNSFKADGDGFFDWVLNFNAGPPASRFDGTDSIEWDFLGLPLASYGSLSVNGPIDKNGFLFATHAQGLFEGGSGWFRGQVPPGTPGFQDVTPIPEPETYALMLAGLAAVAYMNRRRKNKMAK